VSSEDEGDFRGRVVLVTGGFGFIGLNLGRSLAAAGARVRILARSWPPHLDPKTDAFLAGVDFHKGDIRDEAVVERATRGCDAVYHLAGRSGPAASNESPLEDLDVNCRGLLILLRALRRGSPEARVVFPSSRLVYAPDSPRPVAETAPVAPISIYGAHKLACENYLRIHHREFGLATVILRVTNPYGPFQRPEQNRYGIVNWFIHRALDGQKVEVFGRGEQLRDYIHVDDLVEVMLLAGTAPAAAGEIFNVGTGQGTTLSQLADLIVELAGAGEVAHVDWPEAEARVETGDFIADISRVGSVLGWSPRLGVRDGIRDVVRQHREMLGSTPPP
jgi:nucleoside-diphosphate-sugar epimerase